MDKEILEIEKEILKCEILISASKIILKDNEDKLDMLNDKKINIIKTKYQDE